MSNRKGLVFHDKLFEHQQSYEAIIKSQKCFEPGLIYLDLQITRLIFQSLKDGLEWEENRREISAII
jgi:hypothetical protein